MIKEGLGINFCILNKQIYFMTISLLRAFILFVPYTKQLIMNDKAVAKSRYNKSVMKIMVEMMEVSIIDGVDEQIEGAIISLFALVMKDVEEYKREIGRFFIPIAGKRLKMVIRLKSYEIQLAQAKMKGTLTEQS